MTQQTPVSIPLCVDLDGTLIKTDLLWESLVQLINRNPLYAFVLPFWLLRGRTCLKTQIARRVQLDAAVLPYHAELLKFLREEKIRGRRLILATASHRLLADRVAVHVGCFDEVLASDDRVNLRSQTKAARLVEKFGPQGFDYAGNSSADLPVWRVAHQALVIGHSRQLTNAARVFPSGGHLSGQLVRLLRLHQWIKNLIIFVPIVTAHQLGNAEVMKEAAVAFLAFGLCASGLYVLNDLRDLNVDRQHATKKYRPFAAGELPLFAGFILMPLLLVSAAVVALVLPWQFMLVLIG